MSDWITPQEYEAREVLRGVRRWTVVEADCIGTMRSLPEDSIDAIVCDPPYLIDFMGVGFEKQHRELAGDNVGQKMHAWHMLWTVEALRVLKPGGYLLAFGGTRSFHRLTSAVEDAGFEIRDAVGFPSLLAWVRGQGFPKNARTQLRPCWEPIVVARKPMIGTLDENVAAHGVGAFDVKACGVAATGRPQIEKKIGEPDVVDALYGAGLSPGSRATGTTDKARFPPNVLLVHALGCTRDGVVKVKSQNPRYVNEGVGQVGFSGGGHGRTVGHGIGYADADGTETVDAWTCVESCPVAAMNAQAGVRKSGKLTAENQRDGGFKGTKNCFGTADAGGTNEYESNAGEVSRFFPQFYCSKAPGKERDAGVEDFYWRRSADGFVRVVRAAWEALSEKERARGNIHVSVKPRGLCSWLVKLVVPRDGVVLDPFAGSGTTGCAALSGGFRFIGVEQEVEYADIARARIVHAEKT